MKSSNRTLIGFGVGLAVLVIITIVLVLTLGQASTPSLPENTPEGTIQRYLEAVQEKDYAKAYTYLAPPTSTPDIIKGPPQTFEYYASSAQGAANNTWKASLGKVTESGDAASVAVEIEVFTPNGPFGNAIHTRDITFFLQRIGGKWSITAPLDLYWLY